MARRNGKDDKRERKTKSDPARRRWHDDLRPETKRSIAAVIFFALALITLLAYWGRAGFLGRLIYDMLSALVGKAYFLAPATFLIVGASLLFAFRKHLFAATFVGGSLFFVSALALVELFFNNHTGGWIGFLANWPIEHTFDFWAALIIELAILLVAGPSTEEETRIQKREREAFHGILIVNR